MADEPTDMTHRLLREIRDEQRAMREQQNAMSKDLEELRSWTVHALGVVTTHHIKNSEQDARLDDLETKTSGE